MKHIISNLSVSEWAAVCSAAVALFSLILTWRISRKSSQEKILFGLVSSTNDFLASIQLQALKVEELRAVPSESRIILDAEWRRVERASSELLLWSEMLRGEARTKVRWIAGIGRSLFLDSYQADDPAFYMPAEERRQQILAHGPTKPRGMQDREWQHLIGEYEYQMFLYLPDFESAGMRDEFEALIRKRVGYDSALKREELHASDLDYWPLKSDEYFSASGDLIALFTGLVQEHVGALIRKRL